VGRDSCGVDDDIQALGGQALAYFRHASAGYGHPQLAILTATNNARFIVIAFW